MKRPMGERRPWTVLLYMGWGRNPIFESDQERVLTELASARFEHLEVVYQFAREAQVERGSICRGRRELLSTSPPIDIIEPGHLTQFLDWAGETFPSRYTALFAKDHGQGPIDSSDPVAVLYASGIFKEPDTSRYMPMPSFRREIERSHAGRVDLLGLDACRLGTVEVAYELRDVASLLIASQITTRKPLPYPKMMEYLDRDPDLVTPRSLAREGVGASAPDQAYLAVELAWIPALANKLDGLGRELLGKKNEVLAWVRDQFPQRLSDGVDLEALVDKYLRDQNQLCDETTLKAIAGALNRARLLPEVPAGLGVYFPATKGSYSIASYGSGAFAVDTCWAELVGTLNRWLLTTPPRT